MLLPTKQNPVVFYGFLTFVTLLFFPPIHSVANAAEPAGASTADDELSIGLGGRMSLTPYKGYDTQWDPFPIVSYEGEYGYIRGFTAGIKIVNLEFLEISAFAGYDDTSFNSSDSSNRQLRRLSNRSSSAVAGFEIRLLTPYGMLHASGAQDVLGHNNGQSGTIGYMQSLEFGDFELIPAVGLQWSSGRYNDYYYGIDGRESRRSGLNAYDAGAGISPYVGLTIDYSLADAWEIFCNGELVFLNSAVRNSPMVDRVSTYSLMMGFFYTF